MHATVALLGLFSRQRKEEKAEMEGRKARWEKKKIYHDEDGFSFYVFTACVNRLPNSFLSHSWRFFYPFSLSLFFLVLNDCLHNRISLICITYELEKNGRMEIKLTLTTRFSCLFLCLAHETISWLYKHVTLKIVFHFHYNKTVRIWGFNLNSNFFGYIDTFLLTYVIYFINQLKI